MKWILLIGDEDFSLDKIKLFNYPDSINCYDVPEIENRYCVDFGTDQSNYCLKGTYVENGYGLIVPIEQYIKLGMPLGSILNDAL